jgi:hypothetical protein
MQADENWDVEVAGQTLARTGARMLEFLGSVAP